MHFLLWKDRDSLALRIHIEFCSVNEQEAVGVSYHQHGGGGVGLGEGKGLNHNWAISAQSCTTNVYIHPVRSV